jgi:hypothetical protein
MTYRLVRETFNHTAVRYDYDFISISGGPTVFDSIPEASALADCVSRQYALNRADFKIVKITSILETVA